MILLTYLCPPFKSRYLGKERLEIHSSTCAHIQLTIAHDAMQSASPSPLQWNSSSEDHKYSSFAKLKGHYSVFIFLDLSSLSDLTELHSFLKLFFLAPLVSSFSGLGLLAWVLSLPSVLKCSSSPGSICSHPPPQGSLSLPHYSSPSPGITNSALLALVSPLSCRPIYPSTRWILTPGGLTSLSEIILIISLNLCALQGSYLNR